MIRGTRGISQRLQRLPASLPITKFSPYFRQKTSVFCTIMSSFSTDRVSLGDTIGRIEERVQRDEGNRGIGQICLPKGELLHAALSMHASTSVVILTGFPCLLDYPIPTETDGPPGALALAKALLVMGKKVKFLIDECNEDVLIACASAMDVPLELRMNLEMQSFPAACDEKDIERLVDAYEGVDLVIGIERAGSNEEGKYLTMRGRDMTSLIAPIDIVLKQQPQESVGEEARIRSIGIGDGGNELGMGKVLAQIQASTIPNANLIACAVATDYLLVASVSNWGGYALSVAAVVVHTTLREREISITASIDALHNSVVYEQLAQLALPSQEILQQALEVGVPYAAEEEAKLQRMIDAGARDGITRDAALMVDGMPLQNSLDVLQDILDIVCK